jgi:hypothetical protein
VVFLEPSLVGPHRFGPPLLIYRRKRRMSRPVIRHRGENKGSNNLPVAGHPEA